ncbi:MAG: hypothetical protein U0531_14070 [Dehalococcoidia bacterium]
MELSTYRWHGQATLDIRLSLGDHDHHLPVTGSRLGIVERDHGSSSTTSRRRCTTSTDTRATVPRRRRV